MTEASGKAYVRADRAHAGGASRSSGRFETAPAARAQDRLDRVSGRPLLAPWWRLRRREYRAALRSGALQPGVALERRPVAGEATGIFIHGYGGSPGQFAALAAAVDPHAATVGALLYDDMERLAPATRLLREDMLVLPGPIVIVAYSVGTLLPAYLGATEPDWGLHNLAVLYLNPLIGGSRYADADRALAVLGDVPGLRWLHAVKRLTFRMFLPPVVQDLAPESRFQQTIFGPGSRRSSLATRTLMLFTERPGREPDISGTRNRKLFGRSRDELLARTGTVVPVASAQCTGHAVPIAHPEIVLPLIEMAIGGFRPAER